MKNICLGVTFMFDGILRILMLSVMRIILIWSCQLVVVHAAIAEDLPSAHFVHQGLRIDVGITKLNLERSPNGDVYRKVVVELSMENDDSSTCWNLKGYILACGTIIPLNVVSFAPLQGYKRTFDSGRWYEVTQEPTIDIIVQSIEVGRERPTDIEKHFERITEPDSRIGITAIPRPKSIAVDYEGPSWPMVAERDDHNNVYYTVAEEYRDQCQLQPTIRRTANGIVMQHGILKNGAIVAIDIGMKRRMTVECGSDVLGAMVGTISIRPSTTSGLDANAQAIVEMMGSVDTLRATTSRKVSRSIVAQVLGGTRNPEVFVSRIGGAYDKQRPPLPVLISVVVTDSHSFRKEIDK
ncbi:MAG: hypothetical protein MUC47_11480 [Candidatus Kapabacteria bacterium]|nr:hypothetical protein [Candidatus Kapabacteria bacterium]